MVRVLSFFIIVLLFQSCCYIGLSNKYNLPRSKKYGLYTELDKTVYNEIDTSCVYENIGYYENDKFILENDYSQGKIFIKFYSNFRIAKFIGVGYNKKLFKTNPNYQILKNDFDPSKAYMGYYFKKNDLIVTNQFLNNQCQMFWIKSKITIHEDTLVQKHSRFYNDAVYVKRILPEEFLYYKPDW
jgi:hypothetical protein